MNSSVEECFTMLVNLFRRNEDLIRIINCERGRRERTRSPFYMHVWNPLQRIKSVKIVVETSDKNQFSYFYILNLYTNTVLGGSVILSIRDSVIPSVRYRNHFPVDQFQNQAHIWNPQGTGHVFKPIWGAAGAP